MARWTSTAATEESTPPERAQMAWPASPTFSRMAWTVDWMKCSGVQSGLALQMLKRKLRSSAEPCLVWWTSGWNCTAQILRVGSAMPATALEVFAVRWKPGGRASALSPWDIQAVMVAGSSAEERIGFDEADFGVAVFAFAGGAYSSAEVMDDVLQAVADAEDGEAEVEDGGVGGWRVGVVDGAGAPGEDDSDRMVRLDFVDGGGAGKDDGEDVLFADAAGDELGVLRAEVEDDDRRENGRESGGENGRSVHSLVCQGVGGQASMIGSKCRRQSGGELVSVAVVVVRGVGTGFRAMGCPEDAAKEEYPKDGDDEDRAGIPGMVHARFLSRVFRSLL